jgi:dTDP-4-dehydrorhamnose reductase
MVVAKDFVAWTDAVVEVTDHSSVPQAFEALQPEVVNNTAERRQRPLGGAASEHQAPKPF